MRSERLHRKMSLSPRLCMCSVAHHNAKNLRKRWCLEYIHHHQFTRGRLDIIAPLALKPFVTSTYINVITVYENTKDVEKAPVGKKANFSSAHSVIGLPPIRPPDIACLVGDIL